MKYLKFFILMVIFLLCSFQITQAQDALVYRDSTDTRVIVAVGDLTPTVVNGKIIEVIVQNDLQPGDVSYYTLSEFSSTITVEIVNNIEQTYICPEDYYIKSKYLIDNAGNFTLNPNYGQ